jgi:hypothetical protein
MQISRSDFDSAEAAENLVFAQPRYTSPQALLGGTE